MLIDVLMENLSGKSKAEVLSSNILKVSTSPYERLLLLIGNYHNRINLQQDESVATELAELSPFTLTVKAPRGSYWACTGRTAAECKANNFDKGVVTQPEGVSLYVDNTENQYNAWYQFKQLTSSEPARKLALEAGISRTLRNE